jgi:hypothetical protein
MQQLRTTGRGLRAVAELLRKEPKARVLVITEDENVTFHYAREFFADDEGQFEHVDMTQFVGRDKSGAFVQFGTFTTDPRRWEGQQWTMVLLLVSFKTLTVLTALENIRLGLRLGHDPQMYAAVTDN